MATVLQSAKGDSTGTAITFSFGSAVSAGSKLVVITFNHDTNAATVSSVTWNTTETFTVEINTGYDFGAAYNNFSLSHLDNPTPGSYNIVVTFSEDIADSDAFAYELSGAKEGNALDTDYTFQQNDFPYEKSLTVDTVNGGVTLSGMIVRFSTTTLSVLSGYTQTRDQYNSSTFATACGSKLSTGSTDSHGWEWTTLESQGAMLIASYAPPSSTDALFFGGGF